MKREWFGLVLLVLVFIGIRIGGVSLPLHQDEYKWPQIVNPAHVSETEIPHPPLSQFIYQTAGEVVGYDVHFRYVPLFFGACNLILLYLLLRHRYDTMVALIGAGFFTVSFYSILASLMVDTDGQILPFFFLLALMSRDRLETLTVKSLQWFFWLGLLIVSCIAGFFVKVSFVLAIGALAADFVWERKGDMGLKEVARFALWGVGVAVVLGTLLVIAHVVFPFFNLSSALTYWEHFWNTDRNWFQTIIQVVKAILYTSPLLIVPAILSARLPYAIVQDTRVRVFWLYLLFGMIFYTILFDFSIGALDRYLQFVVIPLCVISAVVLARVVREEKINVYALAGGVVLAVVLCLLQFLPHWVPPLYPKSAWIGRIVSLNWTFLYPFSGGSGPLGFYISFLFMGLAWVFSGILIMWVFLKPRACGVVLSILIPLGLMYNGVFAEEYMMGKVNGYTPALVTRAVRFIAENPSITKVVVYNDNGGNEVQEIGKYEKRLYTSPQFDVNDKIKTMNEFKGHYLVVDVPPIDPMSVFARYFATCTSVYHNTDKAMSATVYDCRKAPPAHL